MSLWRVDDDATADWISALYAARFGDQGENTIAALHRAQRTVLNERRKAGLSDHRYYWAGFVAAGDWH